MTRPGTASCVPARRPTPRSTTRRPTTRRGSAGRGSWPNCDSQRQVKPGGCTPRAFGGGQRVKIRRISAYRVELPLHEGGYRWSGGKGVTVFDSTVVRVDTDEGLAGFGEVCPLGPAYLPAYAAGVRTGLA